MRESWLQLDIGTPKILCVWASKNSSCILYIYPTHCPPFSGRFDWNKFLGKAGKSFVENDEAEADAFLDKFREYAQEHLSGDEGDTLQDVSADKGRTKLSQLKPDLAFTRNSKQEALLPADCLTLKLEEKKHVFRCFLKSQYGQSTGS